MISVDYFYVQECMDSLELENEGNCRIGLWNDDNQHWYMGIITSCGWSTIFKMGPYDANGNPIGGITKSNDAAQKAPNSKEATPASTVKVFIHL